MPQKSFFYRLYRFMIEFLTEFVIKYIYFLPKQKEKHSVKSIMNHKNVDCDSYLRKNLCKTLKYAYKNVPYWQQFEQLRSVNKKNVYDILKTLPLLSKDIIRDKKEEMWVVGKNPSNTRTGSTGGTTGEPLIFLGNRNAEDSHQPALYEYMTGFNFKKKLCSEGRIVSFGGIRPSDEDIKNNVFWTKVNTGGGVYGSYNFCSFYETENNFPYYIQKLNELKPYAIRGYSNAILSFADYLLDNNIKLSFLPKGIYVTSEYCSKESMLKISKAFGCNVYGQYGQTEGLLFSWTDPNNDVYYCSPFYGFVEILDECGKPVKEGDLGEVVVTGFACNNQPFIRYKTGDLVTYGGIKNGVVILSELKGRLGEYIVDLDNKKIPIVGWLDIHYLKCRNMIKSYQIEQNVPGNVIFRIVKKDTWSKECEKELADLLKIKGISTVFEYPDSIPLTSKGKKKNIIQHL